MNDEPTTNTDDFGVNIFGEELPNIKRIPKVFLSRRNLLILLSKLDRRANGEQTECTIIKRDNTHKTYPQTMKQIMVTAVEDEEYYTDRLPGAMHPLDEESVGSS